MRWIIENSISTGLSTWRELSTCLCRPQKCVSSPNVHSHLNDAPWWMCFLSVLFVCISFSILIDLKGYSNRTNGTNTFIAHRMVTLAVEWVIYFYMLCVHSSTMPRSALISTYVKTTLVLSHHLAHHLSLEKYSLRHCFHICLMQNTDHILLYWSPWLVGNLSLYNRWLPIGSAWKIISFHKDMHHGMRMVTLKVMSRVYQSY